MGTVYKALDEKLKRIVALKIIRPDQQQKDEEKYKQRFLREVQLTASLQHPHILPIYEYGQWQNQCFYTMPYIQGINLRHYVQKRKKLQPKHALQLLLPITQAVEYAHSQKLIHRDIKPENILIETSGKPYLMDFGLAKKIEKNTTNLTKTGAIIGSPEFMAPEQAYGEKNVSYAADIYALGSVLYFMLSGRPPFQGKEVMQILMQVLEKQPKPVHIFNPKINPDLRTIVHKCLEKQPQNRYPNTKLLHHDLQQNQNNEPIWAKPPSPLQKTLRWLRKYQNPLALTLSLLLISTLTIQLLLQKNKKNKNTQQTQPQIPPPQFSNQPKLQQLKKNLQISRKKTQQIFSTLPNQLSTEQMWKKMKELIKLHPSPHLPTLLHYLQSLQNSQKNLALYTLFEINLNPKQRKKITHTLQTLLLQQNLPSTRFPSMLFLLLTKIQPITPSHLPTLFNFYNFHTSLSWRKELTKLDTEYLQKLLSQTISNLPQKPKTESNQLHQAIALLYQQKWNPAISTLQKLLQYFPHSPKKAQYLHYLALALLKKKKNTQALSTFQKSQKISTKSPSTYQNLYRNLPFLTTLYIANIYLHTQQWQKLLQYTHSALNQLPQLPTYQTPLYRLQGLAYFNQKKYQQALHTFQTALQKDPSATYVYEIKASIYLQLKKTQLAKNEIQQALQISPQNPLYLSLMGKILLQLKKYQKAKSYLLQALNFTNEFDITTKRKLWLQLAKTYKAQNQYRFALQALKKAEKINTKQTPNSPLFEKKILNLQATIYAQTRQIQKLFQTMNTLIQKYPEAYHYQRRATFHLLYNNEKQALPDLKIYPKALHNLQPYPLNPTQAKTLLQQALPYLNSNPEYAIQYLRKAILAYPYLYQTHLCYAICWFRKKLFWKALFFFFVAKQLSPNPQPKILKYIANCYKELQLPHRAKKYYKKYLQTNPPKFEQQKIQQLLQQLQH